MYRPLAGNESPLGHQRMMKDPDIVPRGEDRRPETDALPSLNRAARSRRGPDAGVLAVLAALAAIVILVAKPWANPSDVGSSPRPAMRAAIGSSPAPPPALNRSVQAPSSAASSGASSNIVGPLDLSAWTAISTGLRAVEGYGVVVVGRSPNGLDWRFLSVVPGERDSPTRSPAADLSTTPGSPELASDTASFSGLDAPAVAIGFTWPSGAPTPAPRASQILGPGADLTLWLRNPLGDLDRRLWLGPTDAMPRGERTNLPQISVWPPVWPPGVYRFQLETAAGIRYVFVVLAPSAAGD